MTAITDKIEDIYFTDMKMCGCGRPEDIRKFMFGILQIQKKLHGDIEDVESWYEDRETAIKDLIESTDPIVIYEMALNILDRAEIVEHGSVITSAWLTDKGKDFCDLLELEIKYNEENP